MKKARKASDKRVCGVSNINFEILNFSYIIFK